jgi:hypothetical protein
MEDSFVSWIDGRIECGAARCVSFPSFLLSLFPSFLLSSSRSIGTSLNDGGTAPRAHSDRPPPSVCAARRTSAIRSYASGEAWI